MNFPNEKKNIFLKFLIFLNFFVKFSGLQLSCSPTIFFKKSKSVRTLSYIIKLRFCYVNYWGCPKFDKPDISSHTQHFFKNKVLEAQKCLFCTFEPLVPVFIHVLSYFEWSAKIFSVRKKNLKLKRCPNFGILQYW